MDDIEIVRRALRSSLVSSAPEKLAALDRIEARLKAAEAGERNWADDFARMVTERDKARALAEALAEISMLDYPDGHLGIGIAKNALAAYEAQT